MPRTAREPFAKHRVQIEFDARKRSANGREYEEDWRFVNTLRCLVVPGAAQRGTRFLAKSSSVFYQVYFAEDPGLTVQHRLKFRGTVLNFLGGFQPGGFDGYWLVYAYANSQEQPTSFMNMLGVGLGAWADTGFPTEGEVGVELGGAAVIT